MPLQPPRSARQVIEHSPMSSNSYCSTQSTPRLSYSSSSEVPYPPSQDILGQTQRKDRQGAQRKTVKGRMREEREKSGGKTSGFHRRWKGNQNRTRHLHQPPVLLQPLAIAWQTPSST